jgi:hypothetical protein
VGNSPKMDILKYLSLPPDSQPNPKSDPIPFLSHNIHNIPKSILFSFSETTTPKERTSIPIVRNRRFKFTESNPPELRFDSAKSSWPTLWQGTERRGEAEGQDEKKWVENEFLGGSVKQHVGKLGSLLGDYEEEREAQRVRMQRREQSAVESFVPEEDEESDDEEEAILPTQEEPESPEQARASFERLVREKFIYGLLEVFHLSRTRLC